MAEKHVNGIRYTAVRRWGTLVSERAWYWLGDDGSTLEPRDDEPNPWPDPDEGRTLG